ncbi:MAG TPA: ammonium transporter [Sphingomonadaceae bacterium]|nr:ammonium transporter [Sphingomonadaceae bacterium]
MTLPTRMATGLGLIGLSLLAATPAFAQATPPPTLNSGDTAWMLVSTAFVLLMIVPGLALFYGGLVRAKNMLSLLTQIATLAAIAILVWVGWGYSLAFTDGNAFIGGFGKLFLLGIAPDTLSGTIPEYVFVCFQMTFAAITVALAIGSLAERVKFAALMLFGVLWLTIVYFPLAHMVWSSGGYFFTMGALDYAGGTVVHINAGIAGLVGCLFLGKRIGYQKEIIAPHSMTNTLIGTGLLWVGWFGFNAGSALAANAAAGLAMLNTFVATAAALVAWLVAERAAGHKPTLLGACSGAVAGLVAVTPAAGNAGPLGAIVLGAVASVCCFWFVVTIKPRLGFDDALDVFGIHGIGGIVGSLGTALVYAPLFGGPGKADYLILPQLGVQAYAVAVAILWSGIGSAIVYAIVNAVIGLRVSPDVEREGLDLGEHGERAYNY